MRSAVKMPGAAVQVAKYLCPWLRVCGGFAEERERRILDGKGLVRGNPFKTKRILF